MIGQNYICIPRTIEDPFYRYKMPVMKIIVHKKAGSVQTSIQNTQQLCQSLNTKPINLSKFFGYELGTKCMLAKDGENSYIQMDAVIKERRLNELLDKFIELFVLCQNCTYPQIRFVALKSKVSISCCSCPYTKNIDQSYHRVAKTIIKDVLNDSQEPKGKSELTSEQTLEEKKKRESNSQDEKAQKLQQVKRVHLGINSEQVQTAAKEITEIQNQAFQEEQEIDFKDFQEKLSLILNNLLEICDNTEILIFAAFQGMFSLSIAQQIPQYAPIFKQIISDFDINNFDSLMLLNFQYFILEQNQDEQNFQFIPTILKVFCDYQIFTFEFLSQWGKNEIKLKSLKPLFDSKRNKAFLIHSKKILDWIDQLSENENGEDDDEEIEDK